MYYVSTVIQKLFTPDSEMRRAERHHDSSAPPGSSRAIGPERRRLVEQRAK